MEELTIKTDSLMSFTEAAKILGVSRPTVYNLVTKHNLHPVTIGNNRYLMKVEVERLREEFTETRVNGGGNGDK